MSKKIITTVAALGLTLLTQNAHSMVLETEEVLKATNNQKVNFLVNKGVARATLDDGQQLAFDNIMYKYEKELKEIQKESAFIENEYRRVHDNENLGVLYVKSLNDKTKELNQAKIDLANNLQNELTKEFGFSFKS